MQQNNASLLTRFLESLIPGNCVSDDYTRVCPVSSGRGYGWVIQRVKSSLLRRGSSVRYINPLCEVHCRRKVEWIDQAEEPLPDVGRFLVHPCRFLVHRWISRLLAKFDSLKLTETHR